jgi:DNA-binding PadR family transcriptional regulator
LLGTDWESEPPRGRPPRHLYRLTSAGEAHLALLEGVGQAKDGTAAEGRRSLGLAG